MDAFPGEMACANQFSSEESGIVDQLTDSGTGRTPEAGTPVAMLVALLSLAILSSSLAGIEHLF